MALEADREGIVSLRYRRREAVRVVVVGSFNNWNPHTHPMQPGEDDQWCCELHLPAGVYQFHYLAEIPEPPSCTGGMSSQWSCSELGFVVVTPRAESFEPSSGDSNLLTETRPSTVCAAGVEMRNDTLLPLSRLESALVRGFRRLPDHESRSAFLDVLQESIYS